MFGRSLRGAALTTTSCEFCVRAISRPSTCTSPLESFRTPSQDRALVALGGVPDESCEGPTAALARQPCVSKPSLWSTCGSQAIATASFEFVQLVDSVVSAAQRCSSTSKCM